MAIDPKTRFSYIEIVKADRLIITDLKSNGRFGSRNDDEDFVYFGFIKGVDTTLGWKAHITIDDSDDEGFEPSETCCEPGITYSNNLANAWEIIKNIAIEEQIISLKIVKPDKKFATKDPEHCGKQITIYCGYQLRPETMQQDILYWQRIFTQISHELAQAGIRPAPHVPGELEVRGSSYITYRNDNDGNGQYYQGDNPNPANMPNPFENFELAIEDGITQPPIPAFEAAPTLDYQPHCLVM